MAHIRRHPVDPSKWQVRYIDPTSRERSKTFRRKVDAEKFLIHIEAQKQRAEWVDPELSATPLVEWAQRWLPTRSHLKPKTYAGYESVLRSHVLPRFGTTRLDRIHRVEVEDWIAELAKKLSPSRTRQIHQALSAMLNSAVESRYLTVNPIRGIKLPRQTRREQLYLTAAQVNALADATPDQFQTLMYVMAYGGLRWGEAVALRQERVDVLRGHLRVTESLADVSGQLLFGPTKNNRNRTVTLPSFLRDLLNNHIVTYANPGAEGLLFTASNGSPLRNSNFSRNVWKPTVLTAGLPPALRMHDLRHTSVALLISKGAHPEAIKRHLGHSSIMVTMDIYGHLFPSETDKLADALDDLYRDSVTDKRRTKPAFGTSTQEGEGAESLTGQGLLSAPGVGLEPTTNGLTVRSAKAQEQRDTPRNPVPPRVMSVH